MPFNRFFFLGGVFEMAEFDIVHLKKKGYEEGGVFIIFMIIYFLLYDYCLHY